ncbi:hypothetical protein V5F32_14560 [Xanthobacter oligotrophicus]|uniref:Twin-arginine translocation signal domain-containing protein n=1 Tax=Xanthobacter oligotrophicus TaxID=2607286 RepID=A0ABW6ZXB3_9HYPH
MRERSISRRTALKATGTLGILAAAVPAAVLPRVEAAEHDPLLHLICAYRAGMAAYEADPLAGGDDDAYTEHCAANTWEPPFWALTEPPPARTRAGAIEALRLVHEDLKQNVESPITRPLLAAALGYFERDGGT